MTCSTDHLGPVGCHLLENTICNLVSHCGNDPRWEACDFSYQVPWQIRHKTIVPYL